MTSGTRRGQMARGAAALLAGLLAWTGPRVAASAAPSASTQDPPPPNAADVARLQGEVGRLAQEVREQRQLILQLMQMHDALLKYVQLGASASGASAQSGESGPAPGSQLSGDAPGGGAGPFARSTGPGAVTSSAREAALGAAGPGNVAVVPTHAPVTGKVHATGVLGEAYVYVDGPKVASVHGPIVEIKQAGKRFVPAVAVVQMGSRVSFPNADRFLHNVFSPTPGDAFDLGPVKTGDKPDPVVMLKPGHVEVFCNIHSNMRADILVTPNGWFTRVRPDGSFQLAGIPVGWQRIVLWGPQLKPVAQRVAVTPGGTILTFQAEAAPVGRAHLNKQGGAYESYER